MEFVIFFYFSFDDLHTLNCVVVLQSHCWGTSVQVFTATEFNECDASACLQCNRCVFLKWRLPERETQGNGIVLEEGEHSIQSHHRVGGTVISDLDPWGSQWGDCWHPKRRHFMIDANWSLTVSTNSCRCFLWAYVLKTVTVVRMTKLLMPELRWNAGWPRWKSMASSAVSHPPSTVAVMIITSDFSDELVTPLLLLSEPSEKGKHHNRLQYCHVLVYSLNLIYA